MDSKTYPRAQGAIERAVFAGGCFWGMEDLLRKLPGVVETTVGYTGGTTPHPTYETVRRGDTGHTESIEIKFDPERISYRELLRWFFRVHDPTTLNRQGGDRGSQYRSAIFYENENQREAAEEVKLEAQARWQQPIVTQVAALDSFYSAEGYHQDYLEKNPGGYTCHWVRD